MSPQPGTSQDMGVWPILGWYILGCPWLWGHLRTWECGPYWAGTSWDVPSCGSILGHVGTSWDVPGCGGISGHVRRGTSECGPLVHPGMSLVVGASQDM